MELLKYGFHIAYVNKYDAEWISIGTYMKEILNAGEIKLPYKEKDVSKSIMLLPSENIMILFGYLDAVSLCSVSEVNQSWNKAAASGIFWENLCQTKFNISPSAFRSCHDTVDARLLYSSMVLYFRDLIKEGQGFKARPTISSSFLQPVTV
mmetsp:Transcript_31747/g.32344  ORF Transcript_31747/g.32344 Transcript_31747/m.32344 type:complete len:151 (-) Transcript_31747:198-650(-)